MRKIANFAPELQMSDIFKDPSASRVVIIGGGFAGLELAKKLSHKPFQVYLLDRNNYHTFQPLLYQVATGGLGSDAIAYPLRKVIAPLPNVAFRMASVEHIDTEEKVVQTDVGPFPYDTLVIATGSNTNFFGNKNLSELTMPLKSIPEALDIRSYMLQEFEKALVEQSTEAKQRSLKFVIVGGGPTGVELAGAMAEIKKNVIASDYRELDKELMNIHLVEAGPRLLAAMTPKSSDAALEFLRKMGVDVKLNTAVQSYDGEELQLGNGEKMKTETVIWSAGVKGNFLDGLPDSSKARGNRILVDTFNKVEGTDNVYAIGDVAMMQTEQFPHGHPMVAPVAMQQAKLLGENIIKWSKGKSGNAFKYTDKGSMATIGRNKAVVDLPWFRFKGWFAWIVWMFVHLIMLVGFRNRLVVFVNWAWNYLTYERAIRLIIRPFKKKAEVKEEEGATA